MFLSLLKNLKGLIIVPKTPKKEIVVFDEHWPEVDPEMWPVAGSVVVCKDAKVRLGSRSWMVSIMGDGKLAGDMIQRGLFWQLRDALTFSRAIQGE